MTASELKAKLGSQEPVFGSWITLAHPSIPEVLAPSGYDFLVVDMEHSVISLSQAQQLIQVIQSLGMSALVRVGELNDNLIKRVMDAGANGVIVPMVTTEAQAKEAVQAAYYPPRGIRGVGLARAQGYGNSFEAYKKWQETEAIVMVLIEHKDAIENLESILSVEGIDASLIGPYDLSASMGSPGEKTHPEVLKAVEHYETVCKQLNKPMGYHIVEPDPQMIQTQIKKGYRFIPLGMDALLLGLKSKEVMQMTKVKESIAVS